MKHIILLILIFLFSIKIQAQQTLHPNKKSKDTLEMEYRNGLPYAGKGYDFNIVSYYEAGNLIRKDSLDLNLSSLKTTELYENNKLVKKMCFFFEIPDNPKGIYEGKYKDEKPFDGYFLDENVIEDLEDIPVVSFYDKGILKYKYTTDYLNTIDNYIKINLDKKATFINDKIYEGFEYNNSNRNILVGINYINSAPNYMELNLFGIHYFNRFIFEIDKNQLTFNELQSGATIKVIRSDDVNFTEVIDKNGNVLQNSTSFFVKEGEPNSITSYAIENGKLVFEFIDGNYLYDLTQKSDLKLDNLTMMIYSYFLSNSKQSLETIFFAILNEFKKNEFQKYSDFFSSEESLTTTSNRIGGLYYDEKGNPSEGVIIKESNDQFEVKVYRNGKLTETKVINDMSQIRAYFEVSFSQ